MVRRPRSGRLEPRRDGIGVGLGVILLAIVMAWQASRIPSEAAYAQVGPAVVPWIVVGLLAVLGAAIVAEASLGRWTIEGTRGALDGASLGWVVLGLLLNVATISYLEFIVASTALFVCAARGFGSRHPLRDAGVGFAIAVIAYVGFDRGLGYEIGGGLIENLL